MSFRSPVIILAILFPLVGAVGDVRADKKSEAREFFTEGSKQYDLGEYAAALKAFKAAYLKVEDPSLLFNIAQAHRQLNEKAEAIKFYRTYLSKLPGTQSRAQVEKVIAELDAALQQERAARTGPPQGTVPPTGSTVEPAKQVAAEPAPAPTAAPTTTPVAVVAVPEVDHQRGRTLRIAGLAVGGFGILALGAGGGFVGGASAANDQIVSTGTFDRSQQDRRDLFQSLDVAFFAIGAAAVVTGTTLFLIGRHNERKRSSPSASRSTLNAGVRF